MPKDAAAAIGGSMEIKSAVMRHTGQNVFCKLRVFMVGPGCWLWV